jgi:xylulokinase
MFLGIDLGTQSVKVLLYDAELRQVVDVRSAPLNLISDADGTREQLAAWWLEALGHCLTQLARTDRDRILAIGVSGQQHGLVPLGESDQVLAPVKLWCDTVTNTECAEITQNFGGRERCISQLGNPILPGYTASKILWLKKHRPAEYARLTTILLPHDYINLHLTGERVMEYGDASGTGMLNIRQRIWDPEMLRAIDADRDLQDVLPPLVTSRPAMGRLRASVAQEWGLPTGIPVASGGGDNMMAAIGTGNVSPGRLTLSLGTSGTMFSYSDEPVIDPEGQLAAFCSSTGGWLPLLCTMNCTVSTELSRRLFDMKLDALEQQVGAVPAGSNGVMTVPFFSGERCPDLPGGKGCLFGLDESNYTRGNLLRSSMESAIYGLRNGLDSFHRNGCSTETIRLTGGGAGSSIWRQMVADIFNLPVSVQRVDEGAAFGAALQALWMCEGDRDSDRSIEDLVDTHLIVDEKRGCIPHDETVSIYRENFHHYQRHVRSVTEFYT